MSNTDDAKIHIGLRNVSILASLSDMKRFKLAKQARRYIDTTSFESVCRLSSPERQRYEWEATQLNIDTELSTFRYCSTCKRFLEKSKFSESVKTCTYCLYRSRQRAAERRRTVSTNTKDAEMKLCSTLFGLRACRGYCSSCKRSRPTAFFLRASKTCTSCLNRRRKNYERKKGALLNQR